MLTMNIKSYLFTLLAMFSSYCYSDTYIYITNNSSETLSINVSHSGKGDTLREGSEWTQDAQTLMPWETKKVLSFNRNWGVKNKKKYYFTTSVTSESGKQVNLQQYMRGSWWGSSLKYKLSAADVNTSYKSGYSIHRFTSHDYSDLSAELAFRAKRTSGYDDIYYTITPVKHSEPLITDDSSLKLMTYNIWALPFIASHISDRLDALPEFLSDYDVIAFQEVFSGERYSFLQELSSEYPYQTEVLDAPGFNAMDGGVIIVSRYPIVATDYHIFSRCSGTDCLADKGAVYAEVVKGSKSYHVFATHAASTDSIDARVDRIYQFSEINSFARKQNIPNNEVVIYSGDFNVNKNKFFTQDYQWMHMLLRANEPTYTGYTSATYDPTINSYASSSSEYLDYVVVSTEYGQVESNTNRVDIPRSTSSGLWYHWDLSDHFPVVATIAQ